MGTNDIYFVGRMRIFFSVCCFLSATVGLCQSIPERPLGANLTDVSPFGTLWYYTNALKQSSGWLVYNLDEERDPINFNTELTAGVSEAFDGQGYPLRVPFTSGEAQLSGKRLGVSCLVLNGQPEPHLYPAGTYLLIFEGTGTIAVQGDLDGEYLQFNEAGSYEISISNPSSFGLQLTILVSDRYDPVRHVELIFPDYVDANNEPRFQQEFLQLASEFDVLRYMKPLRSENNTIRDFRDRSLTDHFSHFLDLENTILPGMPYEDVLAISNLTGTNPWITIPYLATDEYVRELAALVDARLDEDLTVYIEYGNETWNPAYPATRAHMLDMGASLATSTIPEVAEFEAIHRYHALRSLEIFRIFEDQFDDDSRLFRVHGAQSDPFTADLVAEAYQLESVNPDNRMPDGVAIASYIGVTLFDDLRDQNIEICDHTPQDLLDTLLARTNRELEEMVTRYTELFTDAGIEVIAYEGGQHLTELNFQPMEPCAADLVAEVNRLQGMETFFCNLLDQWYDTHQGGLFNVFNLAEGPDDFGSFGILESQWQETTTSPKWSGLFDCDSETLLSNQVSTPKAYVLPTATSTSFQILAPYVTYVVYDMGGIIIEKGINLGNGTTVDASDWPPGIYIVRLGGPTVNETERVIVR